MIDELFLELVEKLERVWGRSEGEEYLKIIAAEFGLSNIAYLGINIPSIAEGRSYLLNTYSDRWCAQYVSKNYIALDPVVRRGMQGMLPLDWKTVRSQDKKIRKFFGEANEFGVGQQGLSFPIRGAHGETALFSINFHVTDDEWEKMKIKYMRDFQTIAYHFHQHVLQMEGVEFPEVKLSRRQSECLKWAAAGKTSAEIAEILQLEKATVDFYCEGARAKLGAANRAHAVAKAAMLRLI